jgi:hypothetical protein
MELKSTRQMYELHPDQLIELFADKLNVDKERVTVDFVIEEIGGDPLDRYPGTDTVTKIKVTVES